MHLNRKDICITFLIGVISYFLINTLGYYCNIWFYHTVYNSYFHMCTFLLGLVSTFYLFLFFAILIGFFLLPSTRGIHKY